jgi:hypothetical protein
LGDKVSLGRWYEHERRTMNPPDTERTVKSHRGQLLTVRRAEEATAMAFRRWGWLRRSKAVVKAPAALEGRGESEARTIQGREGGVDGAHRRGCLAAALHMILARLWLSND